MKKLIVLIIVVGALVLSKDRIIQMVSSKQATDKAQKRVVAMLDGWQKGGTGVSADAQTAICQYYAGVIYISDRNTLEVASDSFDRFREAKGLYRAIKSYEIVSSEPIPNDPEGFIVHIKIEDKPYSLEVAGRGPIKWADGRKS